MSSRQRPADLGADRARHAALAPAAELRSTRLALGLSIATVARSAGMSPAQLGRLEHGHILRPSIDQVFRAASALGLAGTLRLFPSGSPVRDAGQLALFGRFERLTATPLRVRREVTLPIAGDLRAWDGMIVGDGERAFIEAEMHLGDTQALARRIELKLRDDPRARMVILVVARSAHNRWVLLEHRGALRGQFPLDGAAIARSLRAGRVPPAGGIIAL